MNIWQVYSYYDYENAYYRAQYYKCKEIGLYLLSQLKDDRAKELYKQLEQFEYDWLHPTAKDAKLLLDIKIWLMVNQ